MKWFFSPIALAVWTALDKPSDWEVFNGARLTHRPSNVTLWVSNGPVFFNIHEGPGSIGLVERFIVWQKYKRMSQRKVANKILSSLIGE